MIVAQCTNCGRFYDFDEDIQSACPSCGSRYKEFISEEEVCHFLNDIQDIREETLDDTKKCFN